MTTASPEKADLLRTTLIFKLAKQHVQNFIRNNDDLREPFDLFEQVKAGKLTEIDEEIQHLQKKMSPKELADYLNQKDNEGKTALFYAW